MSIIISTTAPIAYDADGDEVGYDIPDEDPVSIEPKWLRRWGRDDELIYVVTWANGITAEVFTLNPGWLSIATATHKKHHEEAMRNLDTALAQAGEPLNSEAA